MSDQESEDFEILPPPMQPIAIVAAPVAHNRRHEGVYRKWPWLRELVRLEDVVQWSEVTLGMICQPQRGVSHFMRRIRRLGTPRFQESFLEWIIPKREAILDIRNGRHPRHMAEVPISDPSDSESDGEEQQEEGFRFNEEDYDDFSQVIMPVHWIRANECLCNLLENVSSPGTHNNLLKFIRATSRESVRSLTNTFEGELSKDPSEFLGLLLFRLNLGQRFEVSLVRRQSCTGSCRFDRILDSTKGVISQGNAALADTDLQTYIEDRLHLEEVQEQLCNNCNNISWLKTEVLLEGEYFAIKIPQPIGATVAVGREAEYTFNEKRFRISALVKEEDGLCTEWIRQADDSYTYHHREIRTNNCSLPGDLTHIVLIIFVRSQ